YKDYVYFSTPDAHLISLDARNGKVRWDIVIADVKKGYWTTVAPLVIRDHLLVGTSGDFDNLPGMLKSIDPETGDTQWTFYSTLPNPAKEPARDGRLIAPDEGGATNYRSPSFDAQTGLFIVSAQDSYGIYFSKPEHGEYGWAGADYGLFGKGTLRAIDYQTGKIRWTHDLGGGASGAGVLTTDSGLTFTGDSVGSVLALRTRDGTTLWHSRIGRVGNSPI